MSEPQGLIEQVIAKCRQVHEARHTETITGFSGGTRLCEIDARAFRIIADALEQALIPPGAAADAHAQEEKVDAFTPVMWVSLSDEDKWSEYVRVRALLTAVQEEMLPPGAARWQPIETAPKDDTWVLGWNARNPAMGVRETRWHHNGFQALWRYDGDFEDWYPTHWAPLPSPPAVTDEGTTPPCDWCHGTRVLGPSDDQWPCGKCSGRSALAKVEAP